MLPHAEGSDTDISTKVVSDVVSAATDLMDKAKNAADMMLSEVVDENSHQVSKRAVKLINLTENGAMVTGLEKGEIIATAGVNMLVEGQQVRLLD